MTFPLANSLDTYTVSWTGEGYRETDPVEIGVMRNLSDPYKIDFTPLNTAVIVTDRWANLSGTITKLDGGGNLSGVTIRLVGQGLSLADNQRCKRELPIYIYQRFRQAYPRRLSVAHQPGKLCPHH